ncbi:RtcB family protein [Bacillus circulans]|uniref:RtcB family protein n=1 Tax=Niallia circulans TaxID=1397 RepID=UPI00148F4EB3|nr:RtcB family protein [Niallia circulans]NRG28298.1 RtcB family protein [Niallia circulans]QJX62591.1 RtcB family protein [Niallia circulans]UQZ77253.1 RNA-splicing ligase RtcB [Niallia circulans]
MIELTGKYNRAKVFTDQLEEVAEAQIKELCDQEFAKNSKIRIMPDTHAGVGCTIGTTMTIQDKIVPNLVGVDIGCGMAVAKLTVDRANLNFDELDETIRKFIPSGFSIRDKAHSYKEQIDLDEVKAPINKKRAEHSIGTLGGGNHFIELNEAADGSVYLVIHSGSRNLGAQVAEYYQTLAYDNLVNIDGIKKEMIVKLKKEGRHAEIQESLKNMKLPKINKELAYLESQGFKDYMHDMKIAQKYAYLNRLAMIDVIVTKMNWAVLDQFTTIHNYIDMENMILRKGAISARKGERVIIPLNMRDGSIIAFGKGNDDWNQSAPHGAGRLMSRTKARKTVSLKDFETSMKDVWSTSVKNSTLDESPFAYKPMEEIIKHTAETIDIAEIIKPLYNFKAN